VYVIVFVAIALIGAIAHITLVGTAVAETLLLYLIVVNHGLQAIYAFLGHYFNADKVAESIGWPKGNPFQQEVAFANLGIGLAALLGIFLREYYWLAIILVHLVFGWGAGYTHIQDIRKSGNQAINNAGPVLYADFAIPGVSLLLWFIYMF